jgi:tRNA (uracil-5-)-methyltransferase TRM9
LDLSNIEFEYVYLTYSNINESFYDTRKNRIWPGVKEFIMRNSKNRNKFLDLGCGSGKYVELISKNSEYYGLDICKEFIDLINDKYNISLSNLMVSNVTNIPLPNDYIDNIINIAVIHHLSNNEKKIQMLSEIYRVLKPNGSCLITAWTFENESTATENSQKFVQRIINRSKQLDGSDYLIPWTDRKNNDTIHYRYYHIFVKNELEKLIVLFNGINDNKQFKLINSFYEENNYIIEIVKN